MGFEGTGACTILTHRQQACSGRCVSITLKALPELQLPDILHPRELSSPPQAGQHSSSGRIPWFHGEVRRNGLRAECLVQGGWQYRVILLTQRFRHFFLSVLIRSCASAPAVPALFARSFSELLPNCIRCSFGRSAPSAGSIPEA